RGGHLADERSNGTNDLALIVGQPEIPMHARQGTSGSSGGAPGSAPLESILPGVADGLVANGLVDRVRGRVRTVGVQAAEGPSLLQQASAQRGDQGAGVPLTTKLRRRVHRADAGAMARASTEARQRGGPAV